MQISSLLQIEAECHHGALAKRIGPISDDTLGYFIVLFTILLLHWRRKLKPQVAGYGSLRRTIDSQCGRVPPVSSIPRHPAPHD
jgi:hypothetical protein